MKNLLITGGAGFVGTNFVQGNILDQTIVESLLVNHKIDIIVNFAAESHVDRSILSSDEFINTNIVGTHTLLKAAKKNLQNNKLVKKYSHCPSVQNNHPEILITHVTDRLGHDRRYAINADKISSELGYSPKESFTTGIQKTLEWYLTDKN